MDVRLFTDLFKGLVAVSCVKACSGADQEDCCQQLARAERYQVNIKKENMPLILMKMDKTMTKGVSRQDSMKLYYLIICIS